MDKELEKALAGHEAAVRKISEDVAGYSQKAAEEIKKLGAITAETSGKLGEVTTKAKETAEGVAELKARILEVEQKAAQRSTERNSAAHKSAGRSVVESAEFKAINPRSGIMLPVMVGSFHTKAAIVTQPGVLTARAREPGIVPGIVLPLTLRDLIPSVPVSSNAVEFAREVAGADIEAVPQYASPNKENVAKKESTMTFELASEPVQTIAHFIPASRQVLADAPMLAGYIDTRLSYGLKLEEEDQILNGNAAGGNLNGLLAQAATYSGAVSGETSLDSLLRMMAQVATTGYAPTGIVMHPTKWTNIQLLKDTTGKYLFGDPQSVNGAVMWGLPVSQSSKMTATGMLVGAFAQGATLYDREDATVRIAEQHSDFFVKNMVAILAEERVALVVYRGTAFVKKA